MAERQLTQVLTQLKSQSSSLSYADASSLLSKAKLLLLQLNALTPASTSNSTLLGLARETYEQGALASIRAKNPDAFTRYVSQLAAFYELPPSALAPNAAERNKVTGLYLLLLLTQGRYAEFHSELEALSTRDDGGDVEGDRYLGYPVRLERWLMEGSYDRVWKAMKKGEVPCEEYGIFSDILTQQIRSEIASSSERAYPSLPLSSTKSLLFLDSEGAVVDFARSRGWIIKDGQIFFPSANAVQEAGEEAEQEKETSQMLIENTLGYARQLETIV
ncbi:GANP/Nin1/mts3/eIF-3 p25 family protein [Lasiosphaeria hispida]|uniref:GANP/Nin1/mts3/eIF-3 p25 family protein n=1 Tax=Lasiosphaeria hispida TaxID=260671 RepID=A0AAJ0MAY6_9PEZI|nr:GANP/Nin1/mts3/eIF-3 p25 family protein [Lasiosphaeria hispida]